MKFLINTLEEVDNAFWNTRDRRYFSTDTETKGLGFEDDLFSIQIADAEHEYYFNFNDYEKGPHLPLSEASSIMQPFFDRPATWFIHNAKFDMIKLRRAGIELVGDVHCTQQMERLVRNNYFQYSLDACLKRRGRAKNDEVKAYITEHKLYTHVMNEIKGKKEKNLHYDRVPLDLMFKYGCDDVRDCFDLGMEQVKLFSSLYRPEFIDNERKLTKACFEMEWEGVSIDKKYVQEAIDYEQEIKNQKFIEISTLSDRKFENGPIWLEAEFKKQGIPYWRNPKTGNPVFDKKSLGRIKNPLIEAILDFRHSDKLISTYYKNFLYLADSNGKLHANIRTDGTDTGRFSYWSPNLQNCAKDDEDESKYTVRSCLVPDGLEYCFASTDYCQMEYAIMADYANEKYLIEAMNDGEDVHQATADLLGVTRKQAKTLNFLLLYGGGAAKLADALGVPVHEGKQIKDLYFHKLPRVKKFIYDVINTAKARMYVFNAYGRRYHIDNTNFAYKMPNYLIQGTCADIMRHALVKAHAYIRGTRSSLKITIHDELLVQLHKDELYLSKEIARIMEEEYKPRNGIKLKTDTAYSWKSFSKRDLIKGEPQ